MSLAGRPQTPSLDPSVSTQ
ncbi:hypothetical protein NFI96_012140 [Prochilodus magdalenae]|nr:hypothetical protein NFI96_012140 [Prochilodus magdalenae]